MGKFKWVLTFKRHSIKRIRGQQVKKIEMIDRVDGGEEGLKILSLTSFHFFFLWQAKEDIYSTQTK